MNRNKLCALLLSLLLLLGTVLPAGAEDVLAGMVNAGSGLLFGTDNVTITANAAFALDGVTFKQADVSHIQRGAMVYRQVLLRTPQEDGTERETGYAFLVDEEGKTARRLHSSTVDYDPATTFRSTVLRRSVETDALVSLCRGVASQLEAALPEGALTREEDTWTLHLTAEHVPEAVDSVLTLLLQSFGSLTKYIDYHYMEPSPYARIEHYGTVTEGILYCAAGLRLEQLDLEVQLDAEGRLTQISGAAMLTVTTRGEEEHALSVTGSVTMTDYGTSVLPRGLQLSDQ